MYLHKVTCAAGGTAAGWDICAVRFVDFVFRVGDARMCPQTVNFEAVDE